MNKYDPTLPESKLETRGELVGVGSPILPCVSQRWNLGEYLSPLSHLLTLPQYIVNLITATAKKFKGIKKDARG